jgi:hypothetical protein
MNNGIMLHYLESIVKPYLNGHEGALIIDEFAAHWTPTVIDKCNQMKLRMIRVPAGETSRLQPLDISTMGPMSMAREKIYLQHKNCNPEYKDNVENAIERANNAYKQIKPKTILKGFKQVCPLL